MSDIARLRRFIHDMTRLVDRTGSDETAIREDGGAMLRNLVSRDDWLPDAFAVPDASAYRQYLLWCDPLERFSVVSFVWGPGQATPVHDHTVWGLIGMLRGAEDGVRYAVPEPGRPMVRTGAERLTPGAIGAVSPAIGDIHTVANALADRASISVHVYGANIGAVARHTYDPATGLTKGFVSGYSSETVPNLFDRSAEVRAAL